jgi:hypothetical protein
VAGTADARKQRDEKAERRAAREVIAAYHQEQLGVLLEHVRSGFAQLDAGAIDEFELDSVIHHYSRSAKELWKFCELPRNALSAVGTLSYLREEGREPDWWERGEPQRRRSS